MVGDAKLLFQVFSNLLSNAIKYSPGGGEIEIEATSTADEVVVAIADRGIGIPPDDLPRLFERYHRGSNVSGIVGTGVGLYLVKMAVDLHHGSVEVDEQGRRGLALHRPLAARAPGDERSVAERFRRNDGRLTKPSRLRGNLAVASCLAHR